MSLTPLIELRELQFAVTSLASGRPGGSHEKSNAENAARGINSRIDWIIATLEAAKEGNKNMGVTKRYEVVP